MAIIQNVTTICTQSFFHIKKVDQENNFSEIVMFGRTLNVQLRDKILKFNYPKLEGLHFVKQNIFYFSNIFL